MSVSVSQEETNSEFYMEKEVLLPYTHLLKMQGKQLRRRIPLAFNEWFKVPEHQVNKIMCILDMVYNGTLLIDDIQDDSTVRRGVPAAHCVYGLPLTINACLHVLALVSQKLVDLNHPSAAKIFYDDFLEIVRGQGVELYWRENFKCPTEKQYDDMNKQKTGHMFLFPARLMQLFSTNKTKYDDLILGIGLYFQLRDDYCNLKHQEELEEWPVQGSRGADDKIDIFCEDLTEGKFTLPIIHAVQTKKENADAILNVLRQRTKDNTLKKFVVSELERLGSLQYTRDRLTRLDKHIREEITRLGGNEPLLKAMDELLTWK